ncbi:MAG: citrate synthase [Parcubacteria group bacterium Gr01-1014_107]|nr:MAG: citrate synthase [Parcubacteria group bacterium Gr01-1014_107]
MKFRTKISKTKDGVHTIGQYDLTELIKSKSFADIIFILWRGDLPKEKEKALLEAILVASCENGIEAPSVFVPRISASVGNSMHVALAAGVLSIGERHGGAAESCAEVLKSGLKPGEIVERFKIMPGFGHKGAYLS